MTIEALIEETTAGRVFVDDQDIVGEASQDYIPVSLEDSGQILITDDVDLQEPVVVAGDFGGLLSPLLPEPAYEVVPEGYARPRAIEEDEDALRELAFTGDGV